MSFFVEPGDRGTIKPGTGLDAVTDIDTLRKAHPGYWEPRFEAMKETREINDDLATYTNHGRKMAGNGEYKRVATIPHTVLQAAMTLEPDLLINKKKFYSWLDRNPAYQAYTRRRV